MVDTRTLALGGQQQTPPAFDEERDARCLF